MRRLLTGTVSATTSSQQNVSLQHTGNLRVELTELHPVLLDVTTFNPNNLSFVLALGTATAGGCTVTFTTTVTKGSEASFGLNKGDYCLILSNSGLPEDGTVAYTMTVKVHD